MSLSITENEITSDVTPETRADRVSATRWTVTGFPKLFDRNQAITAMSLVELYAEGVTTGPRQMLADAWREELGLTDG
ncbi:hypothetical protein [Actinomadura sp. GTD37]|uniref:hypothetical protein n=1 Tax=Actinomadura sp. GTD37 TaxID=1778030 RepID=UPI0035C215BF